MASFLKKEKKINKKSSRQLKSSGEVCVKSRESQRKKSKISELIRITCKSVCMRRECLVD